MKWSKRKERTMMALVLASMLTIIAGSMIATAYTSANHYPNRVPVSVKNTTGSTYTGLACAEVNAQSLIDGNFMNTDASDYRVQQGTTFPVASFLTATDTTDACAWLPMTALANNFTSDFNLRMGITTAPMDMVGVFGRAADIATVAYDASLNPSNQLHIKASSVTVTNGSSTHIVSLGTAYTMGINSSGYAFADMNTESSTTPVDQDQQDTEQSFGVGAGIDILGQTFTTGDSLNVTSIDVYVRYISGSGSQFYIGIYSVDGTGSPLASGLVGSRVTFEPGTSGSFSYKTATFSPAISLSAGTQYGVAITNDNSGDEVHRWGYENSNVLAGGALTYDTSPSGGTWSGNMDVVNAARDRTFRVNSVTTGQMTIVGSTSLTDELPHDLQLDFASNRATLSVDGVSIGSATSSVGLTTVSAPLVIASRSSDGIRSLRRIEVGTSSNDADNAVDLSFTPLTLTRTQSGAAANNHRWVYSILDEAGNGRTASITLNSNATTVAATLEPLVTNNNVAPRVGETTPDPWGTSFGGSVASPVADAFTKTDTYRWPMSVIQPSFEAGGLPLQLGAAIIAATLALFMGGAALLLSRIPAVGMVAAMLTAGIVVSLSPLPNVILVMMAVLGISVSFLVPRFWESSA